MTCQICGGPVSAVPCPDGREGCAVWHGRCLTCHPSPPPAEEIRFRSIEARLAALLAASRITLRGLERLNRTISSYGALAVLASDLDAAITAAEVTERGDEVPR